MLCVYCLFIGWQGYLVVGIHSEGHAVQGLVAHDARKALRVVGFAGGAEDARQDGLVAHAALFQRALGGGSFQN